MPTKFLWETIDLYSVSNKHLSKCPVEWNCETQALVHNRTIKNVFWWYFNFFVLAVGVGLGSALFVVIRQIINPKPNVDGSHIVLYLLALSFGLVVSGVALALTFHGEISVETCNQAFAYHLNFPEGSKFYCHRQF